MSVRNDALKQSKQKDREIIRSLVQNIRNHWPDHIISEENLQNPTADFVKAFYSRFYSEYETVTNNIRTNILGQEVKSDQNIYNDEVSFTIKLRRICKSLRIPFNLNDICEPQPKRTLTYFSILMNVLIFLKSNTEYVNEIGECVEKKKHLDTLKESKSDLLQQIGDLNERHVQLGNSIKDLSQAIQNLTKEHDNIMMQKAEKDFKYQQDIKTINKLKEDIKESDEYLNKLREESSLVLEQIVTENEVDKLENEINDLRKQFNNLDIDRTNVVSSLKVQEEKTNFYNRCLAFIENPVFASDNLDCLKLLIEKSSTLNQQLCKYVETINSKKAEWNRLKEDYRNMNENLQKLQEEFKGSNSEYERVSSKIKEDLKMLASKIEKDEKSLRLFDDENKKLEATISSLKNDMAAVKSHLSSQYEQIVKNQENVHDRLHQALLNIKKTQNGNV